MSRLSTQHQITHQTDHLLSSKTDAKFILLHLTAEHPTRGGVCAIMQLCMICFYYIDKSQSNYVTTNNRNKSNLVLFSIVVSGLDGSCYCTIIMF